jgi:hypothetical protein
VPGQRDRVEIDGDAVGQVLTGLNEYNVPVLLDVRQELPEFPLRPRLVVHEPELGVIEPKRNVLGVLTQIEDVRDER